MSRPNFFKPSPRTKANKTHQAYVTIIGVSLATGYFAGRYISAVKERTGTSAIASLNEATATEPDGGNSESDASSDAGDGVLAQVQPSLEEECKLVSFIQHPNTLCPCWPTSNRLRVGPRCTE